LEKHKIISEWQFAEMNKCDVAYYTDAMHKYMLEHGDVLEDEETVRDILSHLPLPKVVISLSKFSEVDFVHPTLLSVNNFDGKWISMSFNTGCQKDFCIEREVMVSVPDGEIISKAVGKNKEYYGDKIESGAWWVFFFAFLMFNKLICDDLCALDLEEKIVKRRSNAKKCKTKKQRSVIRHYKCYTLKRDIEPRIERPARSISCPCWSVRGHLRHYASGKAVFIKPYIKGKERFSGNIISKEHKFFPEVKDDGQK